MNRLRSHKFKLNADTAATESNTSNNASNNSNNSNNINSSNGLFNKITKRYSTLSNKITRRHHSGRKSRSPQKTLSGSYDMTGNNSEDHRPEIGAPILISTTTLDTDRFDVSEARLREIGGGIAGNSILVRTIVEPPSPQLPSSGSENEMFVDALSTTPPMVEEPCKQYDEDDNFGTPKLQFNTSDCVYKESTPEMQCNPLSIATPLPNTNNLLANYYEQQKPPRTKPKIRKQHSKSVQNLHRSEIKMFLQKAPSMTLNMTNADLEQCRDLPMLPELFGASKCSIAATDNEEQDADKENSLPSVVMSPPLLSKSEPNTPMCPEQKVSGFLSEQQHFKSIDSLDLHRNSKRRHSRVFASNTSVNQHGSKNSLASHNSTIDDFNLKSVSCQSLNAQTLFVSIDELNEITRQINESEDFSADIDLEYCLHRDNLKPSERRITLLKNKNARLISFNNNKEKIKKSWNGVKHWIGEEHAKLKEAVQKQAVLQKVGASKLSLSNAEYQNSASVHSSVMIRQSQERVLNESEATDNSASQALDISCDNAPGAETDADDLESSCTQAQADDVSTVAKNVRLEGQNGFEELRRYVKQGSDFNKDLMILMQERVDAETLYSKTLSKIAIKLNKSCREMPGTIAEAWRGAANEMEGTSDAHRQLSVSLTDEIVKPLKTIVDSHHKTRKSIEGNVDKAARVLAEWRVSESKSKKASHTAARENEKLQDAMLDVRIQKSPSIAMLHQGSNKIAAEKEIKSAEKDCAKLDNKRKKAEESVKRADVEYYTLCVRAERARVDWEMAVLRGSSLLQSIENQRLINMKNFVAIYTRLTADMNPILENLVQRLQPQVDACNVNKDLQVVKNIRRNAEGPSEQLLPDFYCEHTTLAMNRERRKHALIKLLQLVKADLERERRSRNGLKGLSQSLNQQENQNITDKLYHIRSMLTYLEGARFKLHSALLELDHKPRSSHPLAQHIQITRDRTGLQQSVLKVPLWLKNNDRVNTANVDDSMRDADYDYVTPANTSANVSCSDINAVQHVSKAYNRSKSNLETFSGSTRQLSHSKTEHKMLTLQANLDDAFCDRGQADGGSNQQDSDFDEFSSQDEDDEQNSSPRKEHKTLSEKSASLTNGVTTDGVGNATANNLYQNSAEINGELNHSHNNSNTNTNTNLNNSSTAVVILSRCKALYSYTPKLYDELELNPGDIIEVHAKQEDGWWLGALGDQVGIFPATYVEEFA